MELYSLHSTSYMNCRVVNRFSSFFKLLINLPTFQNYNLLKFALLNLTIFLSSERKKGKSKRIRIYRFYMFLHVHFYTLFLHVRFYMFVFPCLFLYVRFYMFVITRSFLHVRFYTFVFTRSFLDVRFCLQCFPSV